MENQNQDGKKKIRSQLLAGIVLFVLGLVATFIGVYDLVSETAKAQGFDMIIVGFICLICGTVSFVFAAKLKGRKNLFSANSKRKESEKKAVMEEKEETIKESPSEEEEKYFESTIVCPKCGHINPAGKKTCESCQTKLVRTCPKCGKEISLWDRYCPNCGEKIDEQE